MNQQQIDSTTSEVLSKGLDELDSLLESSETKRGKQLIDINNAANISVLAGILGTHTSNVYKYRLDGKLPPNSDASYRECLAHHINYWRGRVSNKGGNLVEAALVQKTQLDKAKTESQWLSIKKERAELVDTKILAGVFEPYFLNMRAQLCSIARKYPEVEKEIDSLLSGWFQLSCSLMQKSQEELDIFTEMQMLQEIEVDADYVEEGKKNGAD